MPFYYPIVKHKDRSTAVRTIEGLLRLREKLDQQIPPRTNSSTLLLATWNIREFDSGKYGKRTDECFYYIAEIVNRFDLVAVQEVNADRAALDRLKEVLGGWWKYIVTDVTLGTAGNGERLAFLYDSRKVTPSGLAGELVLPGVTSPKNPKKKPTAGDAKPEPVLQFARTPFVCGFKAGWAKFNLCTVHIYYGTSKPDDPRRIKEIENLAKTLVDRAEGTEANAKKAKKTTTTEDLENLVVLGDFNIFSRDDATMKALTKKGRFEIPPELLELPGSNVSKKHHYDQIAVKKRAGYFETTGKAGVFDFFESVFRLEDLETYVPLMGDGLADSKKSKEAYYKDWRTHQMSDHLPMWVELQIDFSGDYLAKSLADLQNG